MSTPFLSQHGSQPVPEAVPPNAFLDPDPYHRKNQLPWYSEIMLRGVFQRAAVAIVLMGALIAPAGSCLAQPHRSGHSCCPHTSVPSKALQNDCCTVRTPLPAVVVAANLPGSASMTVAREFISSNLLSSPREFPAAAVIPPQSPPTGAFNLRI